MKTSTILVLIIVAVVMMVVGGWVTFTAYEDSASVTINTKEIKEDTKAAAKKGEELIEKVSEKSQDLINQADDSKPSGTQEALPAEKETLSP